MSAKARLVGITLDCPNPAELAAFYQNALDFQVIYSDDNMAYLQGEGDMRLGLQKVQSTFKSPTWPEGDVPQQLHLELSVDDLTAGEEELVKLGATKADFQPGADRWVVLLDPVGHPFCITTAV
ncbi:VOC family protein [Stomatohabitans albus]|uniref:VOC family protein n=1 Tax=Stomatohabitans albus TaxID=3110766 RepID=UPI00300D5A9A